jgi:hypothetical protein
VEIQWFHLPCEFFRKVVQAWPKPRLPEREQNLLKQR